MSRIDGVFCLMVAFIIASIKGVRLIYKKLGDVFYD